MKDLNEQLAALSPERRRLVHLMLQRTPSAPPAAPIPPRQHDRTSPLSFAQQRFWLLDQLQPGDPSANIPLALQLNGALDVRALQRSLQALVARHAALRTTFRDQDGKLLQIVAPTAWIPFTTLDLRGIPADMRATTGVRLLATIARSPFDLARGPLLRPVLLRVAEREHLALLVIHHIITDGWSNGVLLRELQLLYGAYARGAPLALPAPPITYADYAVWQRRWLTGETREAQLAYWRSQLADLPTLQLPTDRTRPAIQRASGARRVYWLDAALHARLRALSRETDSTLFMIALAAFDVLLARYSDQEDIVVGSPIAGRTREETEGLIGCFANTLVLRADLAGDPTFRALIGRVRQMALAAYAHQSLPFEQLVEALQPARDLSRQPLFQTLFVLQNAPLPTFELPDLRIALVDVAHAATPFDLTLSLTELPAGLQMAWEYSADLFDATTIARMARHFQTLLAGIAADPGRRCADLPLLDAAERQQILVEWSQSAEAAPAAPVERLIAAQAARSPDAVAVTFHAPMEAEGLVLSYAALDARANRLAQHLRAHGAGPDTPIGLWAARSPGLIIAILGILKAGSAYIPLDPAYPPERIAFMLADSGARLIVTNDEQHVLSAAKERMTTDERLVLGEAQEQTTNVAAGAPEQIVNRTSQIVHLRGDWPAIGAQPATPPPAAATLDHLAYVIYTSGSAGAPKGVLVTRRGLANHCRAALARYRLGPADRTLQLAPLSFDLSVEEILPPLAAGAALTLWPDAGPAAPTEFVDLAQRARLSVLDLPTALWQVWAADPATLAQGAPRDLRLVIVGGERAPTAAYAAWRRALPARVGWVNSYGPTEATIVATLAEPDPRADPPEASGMPIGRPLAGLRTYVLDRRMQPAPPGAPGELHLGGSGLARGYLGRADLTAARFIPNPFAQGSGGRDQGSDPDPRSPIPDLRLYRTGDLARWRSDGQLEFLGRRDQQVKLRGYRVEPGEVEHALAAHPDVRACAVTVRADAAGEPRLVAYIVQGSGGRGQGAGDPASALQSADPRSLIPALRAFLAARLPAYMLPAAFVALDALPLTRAGKLDRAALPAPDLRQGAPAASYVAPRDARERQLAALWEEALGVRPIGVTTSFFDLGGHSLLAVRLLARLRAQTGVRLPLATLFRRPTIAELAQALRGETGPDAAGVLAPIQAGGARRPLFCVHPLGGNVLCYADLARALGPDQPVYGVQAPGLAGDAAPPATVADLARVYVAAIRGMQAAGPYLLCGWSVGGLIALEIAQQLTAQGQAVGLLALLDSHAAGWRGPHPSEADLAAGLAQQLGVVVTAAELERRDAAAQLAEVAERAGLDPAELRRMYAAYRATAQALLAYAPQRYAGRATLFRAIEARGPDPAAGWAGLAQGGVVVYDVPGDHETMLHDPHVAEVAARLAAALDL